jgi:outer membrane biosynthesis protein TonB
MDGGFDGPVFGRAPVRGGGTALPSRARRRGNARLSRGFLLSAGLHAAVILAALLTLPTVLPPPPPEEDSFSVEFGSSMHAQKAEHQGQVAAPTDTEAEVHDNPAITPPKHAPIETAPPPPPPPPPPPKVESEKPPEPVKQIDPPKESPAPAPKKPPPPPQKEKPVEKPAPPVKSERRQPHETKNAMPDTHSLLATLEKFSADQTQKTPPTHVYNPERGGKLHGGGSKSGNLTGELSDGQRRTIGDEVRRCYAEDTAAQYYASYSAVIVVTIDADGEARDVQLSPADQAHANADAAFRAFAERAARAVLDPTCAKLPVPANLLGKPSQLLTFRFRP